jgi:hypothetical protein
LPPEPVAVILDLIALQRGKRCDYDLPSALGFEIRQFALYPRACSRIEDMCIVYDASRQRREAGLGRRRGSGAKAS